MEQLRSPKADVLKKFRAAPLPLKFAVLFAAVCMITMVTLVDTLFPPRFHDLAAPPASLSLPSTGISCDTSALGNGTWIQSHRWWQPRGSWWQPSDCLMRIYGESAATSLLIRRKNTLIIGDSTNEGIYDEVCLGILSNYQFPQNNARPCSASGLYFEE